MSTQNIPNWFDYQDFYKDLSQQIPNNATFVEVGTWVGHSISFFAQCVKHFNKSCRIVAVDNFKGTIGDDIQQEYAKNNGGSFRGLFEQTLKQNNVSELIEVIEGDSVHASMQFSDSSIWGVFIDADHSTVSVLRDIEAWQPKIILGGILAGHDIDCLSVAAAISQPYERVGRCWVKQKI